jgi:hypothetical protein
MKKLSVIAIGLIAMLSVGLFFACEEKDENNTKNNTLAFKGKLIGTETCSSGVIGYLIELDYPSNIGRSIDFDGERQNVVKTYNNIALPLNSTIEGNLQVLNQPIDRVCQALYAQFNVPEIVIISGNK